MTTTDDDLIAQVRAWADAAALRDARPAVTAEEILDGTRTSTGSPGPGGRSVATRGRVLAVAAALIVLFGVVAVVATADDDGRDTVRAEQSEPGHNSAPDTEPPGGSAPTTDGSADPGGEVRFRVVAVAAQGTTPMGTWRSASDPETLAQLYADVNIPRAPQPVDLATEVVVSVTIPDDACPPTLERFDRDGTTLAPVFVEPPPGGCDKPLIPKTFVVALEWASVGDRFDLLLPGQATYDFADSRMAVQRTPGGSISTRIVLPSHTLGAGDTIFGTVEITNDSGAELEGSTCGGFFALALESDEVSQQIARPDCLQQFLLPTGVTSHQVSVAATHFGCTTSVPTPSGAVPCLPGGGLPPLPAGEYRLRLDQPTPLVPDLAGIAITVT